MAQAQGMHIDGEKWKLPRKTTEVRRRLYSHLITLDRMIALAIGRPYAIFEQQTLSQIPENIWVDDMPSEEASAASARPLNDPQPSLVVRLGHELAIILGHIQERCFGLSPTCYDDVLQLDNELVEWKGALPLYFTIEGPDLSLDASRPYLKWNRLYVSILPLQFALQPAC